MTDKTHVFFIGWNANGEKALQQLLLQPGFKVQAVFTPTGYETQPMREICEQHSLACFDLDKSLSTLMEAFDSKSCELLLVASFPWLLPSSITGRPRLGAINVHAGMLPKYRGMHPLNWALIKDEDEIGVTVHYIDDGMDSGEVILQRRFRVEENDDINSVYIKATDLGAQLVKEVLEQIRQSNAKPTSTPQRDSGVIFAPKRNKSQGRIKWANRTRDIFNLVRALKSPYPNAFAERPDGTSVSFKSSLVPGRPGEVLGKIANHYVIATADGAILLETDSDLAIGEILS